MSFMPTPVGTEGEAGVPAIPVVAPAFEPMAPAPVPDCAVVDGLAAAVPLTPPAVLGVLVDCPAGAPWPAMLASPAAFPVLCGALDAFSPIAELDDAFVLELAAPV